MRTPPSVDFISSYMPPRKKRSLSLTIVLATQDKEDPTQFRVFEIYKSREAAEEHHRTSFQKLGALIAQEGVLVKPIGIERHELLEDVERGIVV